MMAERPGASSAATASILIEQELMSNLLKLCFLILTATTATASAIAPERPKKPLFAGLYVEASGALVAELVSAGFYRSVDGGLRWSRVPSPEDFLKLVSNGLDAERQVCIPRDFGGAWTCVGVKGSVSAVDRAGSLYRCAGDMIEISGDGGEHWKQTASWSGSLIDPDYCASIAVKGQAIYAVGKGVYRSSDHGAHWTSVIIGRPNGPTFQEKAGIMIGMMCAPDGTLYATTTSTAIAANDSISIQASTDDGLTWKRKTFGLPAAWRYFAVRRIFANTLYFSAGEQNIPGQPLALYRSVGGKAAEIMNITIDYGTWVDLQAGPDGAIYLVTLNFIHRSDDGGKTWRKLGRDGIHPD
jgi:hypothetical protein